MIKVKVICMGRLKEQYFKDAQAEYLKRLYAFCEVEIKEIKEQRLPDKFSESELKEALKKEGDKIKAEIPAGAYTAALCIEGKELSSEALAQHIRVKCAEGNSRFVFIIGSSFGLDESVKKLCDLRLSFSPMTFPHRLARIMLLEQVYRAFSINANTKYHK